VLIMLELVMSMNDYNVRVEYCCIVVVSRVFRWLCMIMRVVRLVRFW